MNIQTDGDVFYIIPCPAPDESPPDSGRQIRQPRPGARPLPQPRTGPEPHANDDDNDDDYDNEPNNDDYDGNAVPLPGPEPVP